MSSRERIVFIRDEGEKKVFERLVEEPREVSFTEEQLIAQITALNEQIEKREEILNTMKDELEVLSIALREYGD